jgi:uncharacterized protein
MIEKKYEDIKFSSNCEGIRAIFLKNYYFDISKEELDKNGKWKLHETNQSIMLDEKAERKFNAVINQGFERLINLITKRRAFYIHQYSGIPLIGTNYFGIIDRNTNLIEVRPNTGCNLDCIYCSVNEGSKENCFDYVVEKDYLVSELKKVIEAKKCDDIEIHIGPQGEPLLYAPLSELIADIRKIKEVKRVSIDTNAVVLNKEMAEKLISAGLTQFNISINAINPDIAKKMAGRNYSVNHVIEIIKYISGRCGLIIAPVWVPSINDPDIEELILLSKHLKCRIGIQNYLEYKRGKRPVKAFTMDEFYNKLKALESKHYSKLILSEKDFMIKKTNTLKQAFKKDEIILAEIKLPGIQKNECLAVAKERIIQVRDCPMKTADSSGPAKGKQIKAKITRVKHNIYYAVMV